MVDKSLKLCYHHSMMNWSYVSGLFDGEGSMGLASEARSPQSIIPYMTIAQSEKHRGFRVMVEMASFLQTQGIKMHLDIYDQRGPKVAASGIAYTRNYRTMRGTIRSYHNVLLMLNNLIPHLVVRKNSAEDLRRFLLLFPPRTGPYARMYNKTKH